MIDQEHTNTNEHKPRLSHALRFCAIPNYKQSPQSPHNYYISMACMATPCACHDRYTSSAMSWSLYFLTGFTALPDAPSSRPMAFSGSLRARADGLQNLPPKTHQRRQIRRCERLPFTPGRTGIDLGI